jgi:hypothetical protein
MSYFIFYKNTENQTGTYYKIAENETDLNILKINNDIYTTIQDTQINFNFVKLNIKDIVSYSGNTIVYQDILNNYLTKDLLVKYVDNLKKFLKQFLDNNLSHSWYTKVNNYYNIISSPTILDDITTYPFTKSFEQYLTEKNIEFIHPLQIP